MPSSSPTRSPARSVRRLTLCTPVLVALALAVVPPAAAQAPAVVTPGSDLLDLSYLTPDTTAYTITIVQGDQRQEVGTFTRTRAVDEAAGEIMVVTEMAMMGNKFADTTRAAWPSLAARAHRSQNPQRTLRFDVADGILAGEHRPAGGETESFEMTVDGPLFDAAFLGEIVAALPLEAHYAVTVPAYAYEAGGVADYTVRVVGGEKITRRGRAPVDVWVVEATRPDNDQTPRLYFNRDEHGLVRIHLTPQAGVEVLIDAE
jgi:hypothetical protein